MLVVCAMFSVVVYGTGSTQGTELQAMEVLRHQESAYLWWRSSTQVHTSSVWILSSRSSMTLCKFAMVCSGLSGASVNTSVGICRTQAADIAAQGVSGVPVCLHVRVPSSVLSAAWLLADLRAPVTSPQMPQTTHCSGMTHLMSSAGWERPR